MGAREEGETDRQRKMQREGEMSQSKTDKEREVRRQTKKDKHKYRDRTYRQRDRQTKSGTGSRHRASLSERVGGVTDRGGTERTFIELDRYVRWMGFQSESEPRGPLANGVEDSSCAGRKTLPPSLT